MNLQDLMTKLKSIEENAPPVAPVHTDSPVGAGAGDEGMEECGMPISVGGPMGAPKQQDNVTMNVSMNGSGAGGISDLMKILRNIENGENKDPHQHDVSQLFGEPEAGPEEPIMGAIVQHMEQEPVDEVMGDDQESWGNSAPGGSAHHTHGIDAITFSGDDMNSKAGNEKPKMSGGGNPYSVSETLVSRLKAHYESVKEAKEEKFDPLKHVKNPTKGEKKAAKDVKRGSYADRAAMLRSAENDGRLKEGEKQTMSRAAKGNEKYGKDGMKALAKAGKEGKDLDKVRDKYNKYDESAKWRDPKHKDKLYTQNPDDDDDHYDYYHDSRPDNDPGQKHSTFNRDKNTDKLHYPYGDYQVGQKAQVGDRAKKGLLTKNSIRVVKNRINAAHGDHPRPNLPK